MKTTSKKIKPAKTKTPSAAVKSIKVKSGAKGKGKGSVKSKKSDKNSQDEFPGYPLYSPSEDITNRALRVDADLENPRDKKYISETVVSTMDTDEEELIASKGRTKNPADVDFEDLEALGSTTDELNTDEGGDDEQLKNRVTPVDFAAQDLDIPGSDDDDQQESVGSEDEENNSYSVGGENHNDLEEDHS